MNKINIVIGIACNELKTTQKKCSISTHAITQKCRKKNNHKKRIIANLKHMSI